MVRTGKSFAGNFVKDRRFKSIVHQPVAARFFAEVLVWSFGDPHLPCVISDLDDMIRALNFSSNHALA
jgi:hypothetical protein